MTSPKFDRWTDADTVDIHDITNETFVMHDHSMGYGALTQTLFDEAGRQPNIAGVGDSIETIKVMVAENLGIAILPAVTVMKEVKQGTLKKFRMGPRKSLAINLVRRSAKMKPHVERSLNLLRADLAEFGPDYLTGESADIARAGMELFPYPPSVAVLADHVNAKTLSEIRARS